MTPFSDRLAHARRLYALGQHEADAPMRGSNAVHDAGLDLRALGRADRASYWLGVYHRLTHPVSLPRPA